MGNLKLLGLGLGTSAIAMSSGIMGAHACGIGDVDFEVKAYMLNIRSESNANSRIVSILEKGDKVVPIEVKNGWGKIEYAKNKFGWVAMSSLSILDTKCGLEEEEDNNQLWTGIVNTNKLNVRSGSGINYSIISTLLKGTEVDVKAEYDGWYNIEFKRNGRFSYGYVSKEYISKKSSSNQNEAIESDTVEYKDSIIERVLSNNLNVRKSPEVNAKTYIETAPKGTRVRIIGESKTNPEWVKVTYKNKAGRNITGFICAKYI